MFQNLYFPFQRLFTCQWFVGWNVNESSNESFQWKFEWKFFQWKIPMKVRFQWKFHGYITKLSYRTRLLQHERAKPMKKQKNISRLSSSSVSQLLLTITPRKNWKTSQISTRQMKMAMTEMGNWLTDTINLPKRATFQATSDSNSELNNLRVLPETSNLPSNTSKRNQR